MCLVQLASASAMRSIRSFVQAYLALSERLLVPGGSGDTLGESEVRQLALGMLLR